MLKATTLPYGDDHFHPEVVDNASVERLLGLINEGQELVFQQADDDIAMTERRSSSPSPPPCSDGPT